MKKFVKGNESVFIQTEETPNPNSLKFIPGRLIRSDQAPLFLQKNQNYSASPFAVRLFQITGVQAIMFGADFITITKADDAHWYVLKPSLLGIMMEFFVNDLPLINEKKTMKDNQEDLADPLIEQIIEIIESRVRPAVAQDGGDIVFESFEDGVVYLRMQGACNGCPSASATLKSGIENMLKYYVPEVQEVRQI